jgi:hypothetical protein
MRYHVQRSAFARWKDECSYFKEIALSGVSSENLPHP